jgi:hypothetical protein
MFCCTARSQPLGLKLERVNVDHNLPILAAVGSWEGHARHRGELLTQVVVSVVIKLLFTEAVGGQTELQHGNARSIVLHDERRLDAGGQQRADSVRARHDLRDSQIEIDVRLKINLLDRDAVEGLRLHVLDAGHAATYDVLTVCADSLLHFRCAQAGVLPDHRHDRNVDLREDVRRHDRNG